MPSLKVYSSAFGLGFLGSAAVDTYIRGSLPTSLKPVQSLVESESSKKLLLLFSPAIVSGCAWIVGSRLWQMSNATLAITSARRVIGPAMGLSGIAFSSVIAGTSLRYYIERLRSESNPERVTTLYNTQLSELPLRLAAPISSLKDIGLGVCIFYALGGRWKHMLPSHALYRGSFSGTSMLKSSLVSKHKDVVAAMGDTIGCHTCGTRSGAFIADLSPPTEVVTRPSSRLSWFNRQQEQVLLPQCVGCSKAQAKALKHLAIDGWVSKLGWSNVVTHIGTAQSADLTGVIMGLIIAPILYQDLK